MKKINIFIYIKILTSIVAIISIVRFIVFIACFDKTINISALVLWVFCLFGWFIVNPILAGISKIEVSSISSERVAFFQLQKKFLIFATEKITPVFFLILFTVYLDISLLFSNCPN